MRSHLRGAVTPFSGIDLDLHRPYDMRSVEVQQVDLEEALLVIRGRGKDGNEYEIQVGSLGTGATDGIALIRVEEHTEFRSGGYQKIRMLQGEYRLLVDCEMKPDPKSGVVFTVRKREANS